MAVDIATYNFAADRQPQAVAKRAYERLLAQVRILVTQEDEALEHSGALAPMPGVVAPFPAVPGMARRHVLYRPGAGRSHINLGGIGVHELEDWPLKHWQARRLIPYVILTDPATGKRFTVIDVHLLHDAPEGSVREAANDLIVAGIIEVADAQKYPAIAAGDFNRRPGHPGNRALKDAGFEIHSPGGTHGKGRDVPIDYAATRGVEVLDSEVLDGYPGDHSPVRYRIRVR